MSSASDDLAAAIEGGEINFDRVHRNARHDARRRPAW